MCAHDIQVVNSLGACVCKSSFGQSSSASGRLSRGRLMCRMVQVKLTYLYHSTILTACIRSTSRWLVVRATVR